MARLIAFLGTGLLAWMDHVVCVRIAGRASVPRHRSAWSQRWARRFASALSLEIHVEGTPPVSGLLVCNHLSYLDIVVLATTRPLVFVSKADVRSWPGFGTLAACAGTLFLSRERRSDVARIGPQFRPLVEEGEVVALFPEGTSSDGTTVLPFKPSLFAPPAEHGWSVTPAAIGYELEDGSVADEVAYWRDMTLLPHLLNLLSKRRVRAVLRFGPPIVGVTDRKLLAAEAETAVRALHAGLWRP